MRIAVVGGGINGVCIAKELAQKGHGVTLFEKSSLLMATSANSSRLLHGGLRYLEQGAFSMVRESLDARAKWLSECPEHTQRIALNLPIYQQSRRSRLIYGAGLGVYHLLGAGKNIGPWRYLTREQFISRNPDIKTEHLLGGFQFYDGYMDDTALGKWVIDRAMAFGVEFKEYQPVTRVGQDGTLEAAGREYRFDHIYCCAGPWNSRLIEHSDFSSTTETSYIRGSHIIIGKSMANHYMMEVPKSHRFFFTLPHEDGTMIGTTEVDQRAPDPVITSNDEIEELINNYNYYFQSAICSADVLSTRTGVRPLIKQKSDAWARSREAKIERAGKVTVVWGGKWTSAPQLASKVEANSRIKN